MKRSVVRWSTSSVPIPKRRWTWTAHLKNTIGRLAVDHLIDKIRGESDRMVKKIILDPLLVIRKSCGYRTESNEDNRGA